MEKLTQLELDLVYSFIALEWNKALVTESNQGYDSPYAEKLLIILNKLAA